MLRQDILEIMNFVILAWSHRPLDLKKGKQQINKNKIGAGDTLSNEMCGVQIINVKFFHYVLMLVAITIIVHVQK